MNVGGTGKMPMADLREMCAEVGFADVATYIASGNVVFSSELGAAAVKDVLEARLAVYAGTSVACVAGCDRIAMHCLKRRCS